VNLVWQPTLLDAVSGPDVDASFSGLVRVELDATSWVDVKRRSEAQGADV